MELARFALYCKSELGVWRVACAFNRFVLDGTLSLKHKSSAWDFHSYTTKSDILRTCMNCIKLVVRTFPWPVSAFSRTAHVSTYCITSHARLCSGNCCGDSPLVSTPRMQMERVIKERWSSA